MAKRDVNVWWDAQSDFLSVTFDGEDGYMVETTDDRVMAKVDERGNITGLHILGLTTMRPLPHISVAEAPRDSYNSVDEKIALPPLDSD